MIISLCSSSCFCQAPKYLIVKGKVTDLQDSSPIFNVNVVLKDDKGRSLTYNTDSSGTYFFKIKNNFFYKAEISTFVAHDTYSKKQGKGDLNSSDEPKL